MMTTETANPFDRDSDQRWTLDRHIERTTDRMYVGRARPLSHARGTHGACAARAPRAPTLLPRARCIAKQTRCCWRRRSRPRVPTCPHGCFATTQGAPESEQEGACHKTPQPEDAAPQQDLLKRARTHCPHTHPTLPHHPGPARVLPATLPTKAFFVLPHYPTTHTPLCRNAFCSSVFFLVIQSKKACTHHQETPQTIAWQWHMHGCWSAAAARINKHGREAWLLAAEVGL